MVTYFKSQKDLAEALIRLIDSYWSYELKDDELISQLNDYLVKNREKLFDGNDYTSVIKQRLGKRRIELLNKVLNQTEDK